MPKKWAICGNPLKQTKKIEDGEVIRRVIHRFGGHVFSCLVRNFVQSDKESYKRIV